MITKMVDPKKLVMLDINPADRVTGTALEDLMRSMRDNGFWYYRPVIITRKNVICDGHRRVTCAIALGIEEIPAYYIDEDPHKVWAEINSGVRTIGSRELYKASAMGLNFIPKTRAGTELQLVIKTYGMDVVKFMAAHSVSKTAIVYAKAIAGYVGEGDNHDYVVRCLYWIVEYRYIYKVRLFIELKMNADIIKLAIQNNTPINL